MHANRDPKSSRRSTTAANGALEIGIDAGGTRTRAIVRDANGTTLATAAGGPANVHAAGFDLAIANLEATIALALRRARATSRSLPRIAIGAAGLGDSATRRALRDEVSRRFPRASVFATSDAEAALAAARASARTAAAIALIGGTGSIALGCRSGGRVFRAGGCGFRLGDEGAATWIARQALAAVSRANDGRGRATRLDAALRRALKCSRADFRVAAHRAAERADTLGALAPAVVDCAARGDREARRILAAAGDELATLVIAVASALRGRAGERIAVCAFGGILENAAPVSRALAAALRARAPSCRVIAAKVRPEIAVLELATANAKESAK